MAWIALVVVGAPEVLRSSALKLSDGFTGTGWGVVMLPVMAAGFWRLAVSIKSIDPGTAYPVWVGIGAIGAFLAGALFRGGSVTPLRLVSLGLILAGTAVLKLAAPGACSGHLRPVRRSAWACRMVRLDLA